MGFRILLFVLLSPYLISGAYAQLNQGLVAHWAFNGNYADSSGHNHHGTAHNVADTSGRKGLSHTAMYFNGGSSYIMVPYDSAFNVHKFSICAIVKPVAFYTGPCQASAILWRGYENNAGNYALIFSDNPTDNDCNSQDTSKQVFWGKGGNTSTSYAQWNYAPKITSNTWYSVVMTFDSTHYKTYVNGVNKATVSVLGGALGTSTDSLWIGASYNGSTGVYPYWLNGFIDDLRIYNRVLADSEIVQYDATNINDVPVATTDFGIYPNPSNGTFTIDGTVHNGAAVLAELTSITGQILYKASVPVTGGIFHQTISTGNISAGIYFIRVSSADGNVTRKIIIQ